MADKKAKTKIVKKGTTPRGVFMYAWLAKPDTSEYGKNKYKSAILLPKGEKVNDEFKAELNALHKAAKGKADSVPVKDGDKIADAAKEDGKDKEFLRGHWVVTAKSNNKPEQVAADGKTQLKESARSGDYGRLSYAAAEYDTGSNKGVTLYLNGIKLLERRAKSDLGFEDESDEYDVDEGRGEIPASEDGDSKDADDDQDF